MEGVVVLLLGVPSGPRPRLGCLGFCVFLPNSVLADADFAEVVGQQWLT